MDQITIDDLLLYSQCPMKLFFKANLGISGDNVTVKGQVNDALRQACYSYLNAAGNTAPAIAARKLNSMMGGVILPSNIRGSDRRKAAYDNSIDITRRVLDRFMMELSMMEYSLIGSPMPYNLVINNTPYMGLIDAVISYRGKRDVITFDFSTNPPSDEVLTYGIRCTIASHAYRELSSHPYRIIHYWIPGNQYLEVNRMDMQYRVLDRELNALARMVDECTNSNLWYRSKGFWCNSCYLVNPCNEIRI